jgi:molybdopterin synthase sulfur carrier subunit
MEILFFGSLIDITGKEAIQIALPADTDYLKTLLLQQYPGLETARFFLALNKTMVQDKQPLKEGDVVALMPAFSGG